MLVREQVVGQGCGIGQALEDRVQEASVAEVVEARSDRTGRGPGQLDLFLAEENLCGKAESVGVLGNSRGGGGGGGGDATRIRNGRRSCVAVSHGVQGCIDGSVLLLESLLLQVQTSGFLELNTAGMESRVVLFQEMCVDSHGHHVGEEDITMRTLELAGKLRMVKGAHACTWGHSHRRTRGSKATERGNQDAECDVSVERRREMPTGQRL